MMYEYWLASLYGISAGKKRLLREKFKSAEEIYNIEERELRAMGILKEKEVQTVTGVKEKDIRAEYVRMGEQGISFVPYFSEKYPKRVKRIQNPPYALYVKGKLPKEEKTSAAIVGARRCTNYGEEMALQYGEKLAKAGVQIISGMARGIDGFGQIGALNGNGRTYGVLGCGVDICYPRENFGLYMDLQREGGIISEQIPGTKPLPGYFPARNRIISALSDVVLVIEAKERSGSLITADMALEQGKDVYALPGPAASPLSQGCHRLIQQGAGILISPEDLLDEMDIKCLKDLQIINKNKKKLETTENLVYSCLGFTPKDIDCLSKETHLSAREVLEHLITLELQGMAKEISKNYYVRI